MPVHADKNHYRHSWKERLTKYQRRKGREKWKLIRYCVLVKVHCYKFSCFIDHNTSWRMSSSHCCQTCSYYIQCPGFVQLSSSWSSIGQHFYHALMQGFSVGMRLQLLSCIRHSWQLCIQQNHFFSFTSCSVSSPSYSNHLYSSIWWQSRNMTQFHLGFLLYPGNDHSLQSIQSSA